MSFWGELKRRNVYKVGAAYAIVPWLIVLLLAWAYEVAPDGIKRTKQVHLVK